MKNPCAGWIIVGLCLAGSSATADELSESRDALLKLGVRAGTTGIMLPEETAFSKELAKGAALKKTLTQAAKEQKTAEDQVAGLAKTLTNLRQQHVQLSAQLAALNPNDVSTNNRLVGALNAIAGQHELLQEKQTSLDQQVKEARAKTNEAREAYLQFVLNSRQLADIVSAEYEKKSADPEVKAAVERFNKALGKQFTLAPSTGFQSNLRRLKAIEETVLSESIPLRDDGGRTFHVSVVVNGKHQQDMVLDSGASLISLPGPVAEKFGLIPTEKDPKIMLQLADGREIEGRLMKIPSVRVGKFTVENVECAVLGAEAARAEPLLGMSFLGNFKFEVDASAKTLTMVRIAGADVSGK